MTPGAPTGRRSLLPTAGLIERLGGLTAVLTGLALCAVVQQQIGGYPAPSETWRRSTGPVVGATHPAAATSLIHRVRVVAGERWARLVPGAVEGGAVPRPDVRLVRIDRAGNWAFGTWFVPPPAGMDVMPASSLFIARWSGGRWQVALAGTGDFARFVRQAPVTVIPEDERSFLEQYDEAAARNGRVRAGRTPARWAARTARTTRTTRVTTGVPGPRGGSGAPISGAQGSGAPVFGAPAPASAADGAAPPQASVVSSGPRFS